ncbi:Uncharacterised protein [[Clostridium] sordellii]|uniref:hypothetical protein n=1 Tax=Paraclostridium sordellii TaxID=1505 RepID=UPI0005E96CD7|nr:hypothetical protein [Paeniclostridium sordellii]CEO04852.1 Uncharacterised protein [[Clostridium] sordellii] [Paeniclostridium sordellii]
MGEINELKLRLREESSPFFSDEELAYYLKMFDNDLDKTTYKLALMKAEDDSITLPGGLSLPNNGSQWKRIAAMYKPNESRCL